MKKDFYYLSDAERTAIEGFLANPVLVEAVKKVLLEPIYFDGRLEEGVEADPMRNFLLGYFTAPRGMNPPPITMKDDKGLGEDLRSIINAMSILQTSFEHLEKLRKVETETKPKTNKAR